MLYTTERDLAASLRQLVGVMSLCGVTLAIGCGDDAAPHGGVDSGGECAPLVTSVCCGNAVCWDDGCGGWGIAERCPGGCAAGACLTCSPECTDRECGDDGCGGDCGLCAEGVACVDGRCCSPGAGQVCCGDALCDVDACGAVGAQREPCPWGCEGGACAPCADPCGERECGTTACGERCGSCEGGATCIGGSCVCLSDDHTGCCPDGGGVCRFDSCDRVEGVLAACDSGCVEGGCVDCDPLCGERRCGPDACGGDCGTCVDGEVCQSDGTCACVATDSGVCCGDSWCAVDSCGTPGAVIQACAGGCSDGVCEGCAPDCAGRACGDDGCGGSCGECGLEGEVCSDEGACVCTPDVGRACCEGGVCVVDSCGATGGLITSCSWGCADASCLPCVPACEGRDCGADGCGGSCGDAPCAGGARCLGGVCTCEASAEITCCGDERCRLDSCGAVFETLESCPYGCAGGECAPCVPSCGERSCGDDGCGQRCGECDGARGEVCSADGACVCSPGASVACCGDDRCSYDSCGGAEQLLEGCPYGCAQGACLPCPSICGGAIVCGPDGCGESCGSCGDGEVCTLEGACVSCVPSCGDALCGDDGCGGSCGECAPGQVCGVGGRCVREVRGRLLFERRQPTEAGTALGPLETASAVAIPIALSRDGVKLAEVLTDEEGRFALTLDDNATGALSLTAVASALDADGDVDLTITDAAGVTFPSSGSSVVVSPRAWAWSFDIPSDQLEVGELTVTAAAGSGALQILHVIRAGRARALAHYHPSSTPTLAILWSPTLTPLCLSCYFPDGWGPLRIGSGAEAVTYGRFMWLSGKPASPHQWAPSMCEHELGHWAMEMFSRQPDEGGPHSWDGLLSPGLAWSEGFATFFGQWSLSVEAERSIFFAIQDNTHYWVDIDRIGHGPSGDDSSFYGLQFPLPDPDQGMTQRLNEAVISAILWDFFDTSAAYDDGEEISLGDGVLDVMASARVTTASLNRGYRTADLVDFLDALRCGEVATVAEISAVVFGFPYDGQPSCP